MKTWFTRFLTAGAVVAVLAGAVMSAPAVAQDKPAAEASAPAAAAPAAAPASDAAAAPAAAAAAAPAAASAPAAATPVPNKGDTAWLLVSTAFVILMTLPGLALFYGGLVRKKNMLSVLMQCTGIFSLIIILWAIYGYSFAFTEGNAFFGGLDRLFLKGLTPDSVAATFSKGVVVPEFAYFAFQGAFADHLRADHRCLRRACQVLGRAAVRGAVVHLQLPADRPHGLVLAGSGWLYRRQGG